MGRGTGGLVAPAEACVPGRRQLSAWVPLAQAHMEGANTGLKLRGGGHKVSAPEGPGGPALALDTNP